MIKKIALMVLFIPLGSIALAMEKDKKFMSSLTPEAKEMAKQIYGTILGGITVHEWGHWIVGKKLYNCKGFFVVNPLTVSGVTCLYYDGPALKAVMYDFMRKKVIIL